VIRHHGLTADLFRQGLFKLLCMCEQDEAQRSNSPA